MCNLNEQATLNKYRVTAEQLDRCSRWIDEQSKTVLYLVGSQSDPNLTYHVRWNSQFARFSCDCVGNSHGVVCWHLRAAFAAEYLYREAKRNEEIASERERLMALPPTLPTEDEVRRDQERCQSHGFTLLR
jgi:hypothetical protein